MRKRERNEMRKRERGINEKMVYEKKKIRNKKYKNIPLICFKGCSEPSNHDILGGGSPCAEQGMIPPLIGLRIIFMIFSDNNFNSTKYECVNPFHTNPLVVMCGMGEGQIPIIFNF